jgi:acetyl-CoA carboxylase biotin carboxyl carrier protein
MAQEEVKSEVTGTMWKIETKVGSKVSEDDVLMIIESMKMEIPVLAPEDGTVVQILVEEETPVSEGQVVAILEI